VLALGTLFLFLVVLKKIPSWKTVTAFSLAIIGVGLPWFVLAWAVNGENFFYTFIVNHHIARFVTDLHHHSQPFWYYIPVLLAGFFPWVFFLFPAASDFLKRRKNSSDPLFRLALYLWLWAGVPILFFSASSAKLPGYILPSIPALALLVALEWRRCREDNVELLSGGVFQLVVLGMALVIGIALPLASRMEYGELEVGLVAGIPLLAGVAIGLWWGRKRLFDSSFIAFSGGIVLSLASLFAVGSPVLAKYHSTSELVQSVNPEISASQPLVQYRFFHHTAAYYTSGRVTPDSINDPGEMAEYIKSNPQADYYLLTTSHGLEEFQALPGTEISGPVGKLYILRLWNGDGQLAQRIEEFSGIFKPGS